MARIDTLREEARKRRAAVTAKERRIFINTGIDIKNTKEDPRRPPSEVKNYNVSQLNEYISKLNNFMARDNGYIPDASGGFIRKKDWLKYKANERKLNRIVKSHFENIADVVDPYRNVTIRQAERLYVPESARAAGEIRHRPYNELNRKAENIKDHQALEKLNAQVEGRLDKGYFPKTIASGRSQTNSMLDNAGLSSLKKAVTALSDKQFDVLFNYWGFAARLSQIGDSGGHRSKNIDNDVLNSQDKDNIKGDVKEYIDKASELEFNKFGKLVK